MTPGRSSRTEKALWVFQLIALCLLPNHDLLNWLFAGTILVAWKQALVAVISILAASLLFSRFRPEERRRLLPIKRLVTSLLLITTILILASYANSLTTYRILYGAVGYTGCVGFMVVPVGMRGQTRTDTLLRVAAYVGIIGCLGLITDYFTSYCSFLPRVNEYTAAFESRMESLRRAAFLFGASTIIYPFLSFSLLAAAILLKGSGGRKGAALMFALCLLVPAATFLTGSRATFLLSASFAVVCLTLLSRSMRGYTAVMFTLVVLVCISAVPGAIVQHIPQASMLIQRYQEASKVDAAGNELRFSAWKDALQLFTTLGWDDAVGVGLGSSIRMNDGRQQTSHYESSFFQSYSECGILGLVLRYFPGVIALWTLLFKRRAELSIQVLGTAWFALYFMNVSTSPTAAALHTEMVYFLTVGVVFCDPLFGARKLVMRSPRSDSMEWFRRRRGGWPETARVRARLRVTRSTNASHDMQSSVMRCAGRLVAVMGTTPYRSCEP